LKKELGASKSNRKIETHSVDQLFLVVEGEGWVRGKDDSKPVPISAGQAAFWEAGEGHESGSEEGMVAMVIEGEKLNPESYMQLLG